MPTSSRKFRIASSNYYLTERKRTTTEIVYIFGRQQKGDRDREREKDRDGGSNKAATLLFMTLDSLETSFTTAADKTKTKRPNIRF